MLKPDITDRINAINTRLNEMVTTAESESRHLTDEENSEKSALLEERGRLDEQLKQSNSQQNYSLIKTAACCLCYCKDTKLKAIHNMPKVQSLMEIVVYATAKILN